MQKDLRDTDLYSEAEALFHALRQPGSGQICDAHEIHASPDGKFAVFAATIMDSLQGSAPTRICQVELDTGQLQVLTFGPNFDRKPKYSPDGRQIAFLSDRQKADDFQLYLLMLTKGGARLAASVPGWVEYLQWSPDGQRILLGVAGHGADVAGGQGAVTSKQAEEGLPSWMPTVETGDERFRWRSVWSYELATGQMRQVSPPGMNIWEAAWCGNGTVAAVASPGAGEGLWYSARLYLIDLMTGGSREVYRPRDQIGWPAASPAGTWLAIVEALCSDRWLVAGELQVIETASGNIRHIDTHGVDITYTEWRSEQELLIAGQRGFETVVGLCNAPAGTFTEVWSSAERTTGGYCIAVSAMPEPNACVLVGEGFLSAPEIAVIQQGQYRSVRSFDLGYAERAEQIAAVEQMTWKASDGLEIQGWLLRPKAKGPYPVILCVHGGPVWHWRPAWVGRGASWLMLLARGYALFLPNPRGSSGRGQPFVRHVLGDMGGADTYDHLSGLDHLVALGLADSRRIGVTGGSYGGFMTSWLITQDARFAAAVPVAPVTNHVSEHLISNIPHFVSLFLADHYTNLGGRYFQRSPISHAQKVKTPTLNICGALDRCTPPEEAVQFHNALLENEIRSALVIYPEEGHGIRKLPAAIDCAARLVMWFQQYMPAGN